MKRIGGYAILGLLLIVAGVLFLLQNLGVILIGDLVWPILLGLGGLVLVGVFIADRRNWWAVIPGFTMLGLAALIGIEVLFQEAAGEWGGMIFMTILGSSFLVVYLFNQDNWWAILPAGVLLTIALAIGLSPQIGDGPGLGGVFFLGVGLTFALLYLLPTPEGRMKWALIPAGVMGVMGLLLILAFEDALRFVGPVALLVGGFYLLYRTLRRG